MLVPDPISCLVVELAPESELLVPYWNQPWVSEPLGLTCPLTDAPLLVTFDEPLVLTVGAGAMAEDQALTRL